MPFSLQHFEQHFPGELVDLGRYLFEKNAVGNLTEPSKHLWTTLVDDTQLYEVEIQITPGKVKASSCDCSIFQKDKKCKHIVASLFKLKQHKTNQSLQKQAVQQNKSSRIVHQKLTTNTILQNASEEDLRDFVKTFARENKAFALALKARFVDHVPSNDNYRKYRDLIKSTTTSLSISQKRISPTAFKRLTWLFQQLNNHWQKSFLIKNYEEALSITLAMMDGLLPLRINEPEEQKSIQLLNSLSILYTWLIDLIEADMGPKLRDQLNDYLKEKIINANWIFLALKDKALEQILRKNSVHLGDLLWEHLDTLYHQLNNRGSFGKELLLIAFKLWPNREWSRDLKESIQSPDLLYWLIHELQKNKAFVVSKRLGNFALQIPSNKDFHQFIYQQLLSIAFKEEDTDTIASASLKLFLSTGDIQYFQNLKQYTFDHDSMMEELMSQLVKTKGERVLPQYLIKIYLDNEDWNLLFEILEEQKDLDLFKEVNQELPPGIKQQFILIYQKALRAYLSDHYGSPAARKIQSVFRHLTKSGEHVIIQALMKLIDQEFKDRKILLKLLREI